MAEGRDRQESNLLDSLLGYWLKLPLAIMQDCGPAVQSLGGILKITDRETYVPIRDIAEKARLPVRTVKNHLKVLHDHGCIEHCGRQKTRRGFLRRTVTIKITKQTKDLLEPYGLLPWWGTCSGKLHLPWCAKAVLAVWMARLCSLKAAVAKQQDVETAEEFAEAIENMGGEGRFEFSLDWLSNQTGLTRHSVITAKRDLAKRGIVELVGNPPERGVSTPTDCIVPNWDFRVRERPAAKPGYSIIAFDRGCKSGR
jgi:hypothetical protein